MFVVVARQHGAGGRSYLEWYLRPTTQGRGGLGARKCVDQAERADLDAAHMPWLVTNPCAIWLLWCLLRLCKVKWLPWLAHRANVHSPCRAAGIFTLSTNPRDAGDDGAATDAAPTVEPDRDWAPAFRNQVCRQTLARIPSACPSSIPLPAFITTAACLLGRNHDFGDAVHQVQRGGGRGQGLDRGGDSQQVG